MTEEPNVTIYVSEANKTCEQVIQQMQKWNISYQVKDIKHDVYRKELQEKGIYATPATFVKGLSKGILGFQKRQLQVALKIEKQKRPNAVSFLLKQR